MLAGAFSLGLLLLGCADPGANKANAAEPVDLKKEIAEILKKNPEIILEVLEENKVEVLEIVSRGAKERSEREYKKQVEESIGNPLTPAVDPTRAILGPENAPILIVEYSDFQCPYCGKAARTVHDLMEKYPGKYRVLFKHVPLHKHSRTGALYFEAISLQDKDLAWKFNNMAFERAQEIGEKGEDAYKAFVAEIPGIDAARLQKDLDNPLVAARVDADMAESKRFKISGTPYFLLNGVMIRGAQPMQSFEEITAKIEAGKK